MTGAERAKLSRDKKRARDPESYKEDINAKKRVSRKNVSERLSETEKAERTLISNARVSITSRIIIILINLYMYNLT